MCNVFFLFFVVVFFYRYVTYLLNTVKAKFLIVEKKPIVFIRTRYMSDSIFFTESFLRTDVAIMLSFTNSECKT